MRLTYGQLRSILMMEMKVQRLHELEDKDRHADTDFDIDVDDPYDSFEVISGDETADLDASPEVEEKTHDIVSRAVQQLKSVWEDEIEGLEAGGVQGFDSWMSQVGAAAVQADERMTDVVDKVDDKLHTGKFNAGLQKHRKAEYDKTRPNRSGKKKGK